MSTFEGLPPEPKHKKFQPKLSAIIDDRYLIASKNALKDFDAGDVVRYANTRRGVLSPRRYLAPLDAFLAAHVPKGEKGDNIQRRYLNIKAGLTLGLCVSDAMCGVFSGFNGALKRAVPQYFTDLGVSSQHSLHGLQDTLVRGQQQDLFRRTAVDFLPKPVREVWKNKEGFGESRELFLASLGYTAQIGLVVHVEDSLHTLAASVTEDEAAALQADLYEGLAEIGVMPEPPRATGS